MNFQERVSLKLARAKVLRVTVPRLYDHLASVRRVDALDATTLLKGIGDTADESLAAMHRIGPAAAMDALLAVHRIVTVYASDARVSQLDTSRGLPGLQKALLKALRHCDKLIR